MQFYISRNGQKKGPFSLEEVRSHLLAGNFRSTDLAWHQGVTSWAPLTTFPEVVGSSSAPRPPDILPQSFSGPAQNSGLATASLILGILSFFTLGFTSLPAVICGHISLSQIKNSAGRLSGGGMAVAGLITGYFGFLFIGLFILAGIALPVFANVQERAQATKCIMEAKQVVVALKLYAIDHEGNYPRTLEELVPKYLQDGRLLECQLKSGQPGLGYDYFGGRDSDPATKVLLSSKETTLSHKKIVATNDGSAAVRRAD